MRKALVVAAACAALACDDTVDEPSMSPFELRFQAVANGSPVGCTDTIEGLGPDGAHRVGISDLRFYISDVRFEDAAGEPVRVELDEGEFQYHGEAGIVSLVDLTGTDEGSCAGNAIAFAEGTARTHSAITGMTFPDNVVAVSFDVGVSQPVMKAVIAETTAEAAPSPLNEMYWSWASGYRHLVFNFTVDDGAGGAGDGYVHVGSRDCGMPDGKALADRDACGFVNTPVVRIEGFDLSQDTVRVDLSTLLAGLDFVTPIHDMETFEVIGEGPGVSCHSGPMQAACGAVFDNLGVDMATGGAAASGNRVFVR